MLNSNYLYNVKYNNLSENLTLRQKICGKEIYLTKNFYMIATFKKFLRRHGVKYTVWKHRPGYIVVNQSNFPRLIFDFDQMDYVKISTIPPGKWQFNFLVYSEKTLIIKMFKHNLIDLMSLKRLYKRKK